MKKRRVNLSPPELAFVVGTPPANIPSSYKFSPGE